MTKTEFGTETQRWYSGAGRSDDLTPERLSALWDRFGHLPALVWKNTVSTALLEPRWPSIERLEALILRAEDAETKRVAHLRDLEAKRTFGNGADLLHMVTRLRANSGFGAECQRLLKAMVEQRLSPVQYADMLALSLDERGCMHGVDCSEWVAQLRAAGTEWARYPQSVLVLRPDLTAPRMEIGQ